MAPSKRTSYYQRSGKRAPVPIPEPPSDQDYDPDAPEEETDSEDEEPPVKARVARRPPGHRGAQPSRPSGRDGSVPIRSTGKRYPRTEKPKDVAVQADKSRKPVPSTPATTLAQDVNIVHSSGLYPIRDILQERKVENRLQYLLDWKPTWEYAKDAKPTKELLKAWQEIKAERQRREQEDRNHTALNMRLVEMKRRQKPYRDTRTQKLASISYMSESSTFSSTQAVEWFRTFREEILDDLELFLFNKSGLDGNHALGHTVLFPRDDVQQGQVETRDKYALWISDSKACPIPDALLHSRKVGTARNQESDTEMQGNEADHRAFDDNKREIILTLVPNPRYSKSIPAYMPCGAVCIRGVANLREAVDDFAKRQIRPPVRQLFDMMLQSFETVVRIAPRLKIDPNRDITLQLDDRGGYDFVAKEITFTQIDGKYVFEWLVVPDEVKRSARATLSPPEPKSSVVNGPTIPNSIRDFTGVESRPSGKPNTAPRSAPTSLRSSHNHRASLPSQSEQRRLASVHAPASSMAPKQGSMATKRKSTTSQTHGRKSGATPGSFSAADSTDEDRGERDGRVSDGDSMDVDEEALPLPVLSKDNLSGLVVGSQRSRQTNSGTVARLAQSTREGSLQILFSGHHTKMAEDNEYSRALKRQWTAHDGGFQERLDSFNQDLASDQSHHEIQTQPDLQHIRQMFQTALDQLDMVQRQTATNIKANNTTRNENVATNGNIGTNHGITTNWNTTNESIMTNGMRVEQYTIEPDKPGGLPTEVSLYIPTQTDSSTNAEPEILSLLEGIHWMTHPENKPQILIQLHRHLYTKEGRRGDYGEIIYPEKLDGTNPSDGGKPVPKFALWQSPIRKLTFEIDGKPHPDPLQRLSTTEIIISMIPNPELYKNRGFSVPSPILDCGALHLRGLYYLDKHPTPSASSRIVEKTFDALVRSLSLRYRIAIPGWAKGPGKIANVEGQLGGYQVLGREMFFGDGLSLNEYDWLYGVMRPFSHDTDTTGND
ncbi:hypothetical protein V8F20_012359 [Naviculisporaceae sp. PSN 640]